MNTAEGGSPRDPIPAMAGAPCGRRRHRGSRVPGAVLHCALLAAVLGPAPSVTASAAEGSAAVPPAAARARIPRGAALPLLGRDVRGPSGQVVAQIVNVLVDEAGRPLAAVLDYGGFMGVGKRRIAVAWEVLRFAPGEQDGTIALASDAGPAEGLPGAQARRTVVAAAPAPARGAGVGRGVAEAGRRSQRGLDWLNFFVADMQTGFGPFVAVYLAAHAWTEGEIGLVLGVGTFVAMVSQVPAGALVDATPRKRSAAFVALAAIAVSALLLAAWPSTLPVMAAQALHGFASCVLDPAIAAISLALVGREGLGVRLGRNGRYKAIGNAIAAGMMGAAGTYVSPRRGVLADRRVVHAGLGWRSPRSAALTSRRRRRTGSERRWPRANADEVRRLLADRRLLVFAACCGLFALSNAAMLPLAGVEATRSIGDGANLVIAACIVVPQLVVRRHLALDRPLGRGPRPAPRPAVRVLRFAGTRAAPAAGGGRSLGAGRGAGAGRDQRRGARRAVAAARLRPDARDQPLQFVHGGVRSGDRPRRHAEHRRRGRDSRWLRRRAGIRRPGRGGRSAACCWCCSPCRKRCGPCAAPA